MPLLPATAARCAILPAAYYYMQPALPCPAPTATLAAVRHSAHAAGKLNGWAVCATAALQPRQLMHHRSGRYLAGWAAGGAAGAHGSRALQLAGRMHACMLLAPLHTHKHACMVLWQGMDLLTCAQPISVRWASS